MDHGLGSLPRSKSSRNVLRSVSSYAPASTCSLISVLLRKFKDNRKEFLNQCKEGNLKSTSTPDMFQENLVWIKNSSLSSLKLTPSISSPFQMSPLLSRNNMRFSMEVSKFETFNSTTHSEIISNP